jgi:hypothetical protein
MLFDNFLQRFQILAGFLGKFGETVAAHAMRRMLDAIYGSRNRAVELSAFISRHRVGVQGKACNAGAAVGLDSEFVEVSWQGVFCSHGQRTSRVSE